MSSGSHDAHLRGTTGEGQTPIDADDLAELRPAWIATQGDLDAAEQRNIAGAVSWLDRQRDLTTRTVLDEQFVRDLHRRMFSDVWRWAGRYRLTAKNIGIDAWRIPEEVRHAIDDAAARIDATPRPFSDDEIAVRLHHRLVYIHPFPNGNGRHARLVADTLAWSLGRPLFSWGTGSDASGSELRTIYIDALRRVDRNPDDTEALIAFARS
jgi:Fic-DOC domain mobile mystery protein B